MHTHPIDPVGSEKGVALIIVLLLLAVMAGLTTGLTLNGQTEITMAANERFHAGARAAAEAGMNRAVEQIMDPTAASLDLLETGAVPDIGNGPFDLTSEYSYRFELVDDDDPVLYGGTALGGPQLAQMNENNDPAVDQNSRMILRSIGMGPRGTIVIIGRVLHSIEIPDLPETDTIISDPAVLVNGDLTIAGNTKVLGEEGNVHANGNITGGGSEEISGDLTATGTIADDLEAGGLKSGGMPSMAIPEIKASDFLNLADYILNSAGQIIDVSTGVQCVSTKSDPCPDWSWKGGTWSSSGSMPKQGTYYVQGDAEMHGTGTSSLTKVSVITEGSLKITGNGKFKPENGAGIQFVTNGDFEFGGTAEADDPTLETNGQIMVREQIKIRGNTTFQGRVMVENRDSTTNAYSWTNPNGRRGASTLSDNSLGGNMQITYNGGLDEIETEFTIPGGASTYTHNISGWLEQ